MGRPRADELIPVMTEGRPKLTPHARRHASEARCPKRHLLAAMVRTPHGVWVLWRGGLTAPDGWVVGWADEIADLSAVPVSCPSCLGGGGGMVWELDLSDPDRPVRGRMR